MTDMLSVILSELISVNTIEISFVNRDYCYNDYFKIHSNLTCTNFPAGLHKQICYYLTITIGSRAETVFLVLRLLSFLPRHKCFLPYDKSGGLRNLISGINEKIHYNSFFNLN